MKRSIAILLALALSVLVTSVATGAPKPSIADPAEDANFINDQGTGDGSFGDVGGVADASSFADLLEVHFTNDKSNLNVHIVTQSSAPPAAGEGFRVRTNPDGPGGVYCLNFEIVFPGAQNDTTMMTAHLRDACAAGSELIEAKAAFSPFGGFMIVVPRKAHKALGKRAKLTAPQAQTYLWSGTYPNGVAGPYLDTTKVGKDYALKG